MRSSLISREKKEKKRNGTENNITSGAGKISQILYLDIVLAK
jgi:hypothetical protein